MATLERAIDSVTKRDGESYDDFVARANLTPLAGRSNSLTSQTTATQAVSAR